jgi:hypothetical protein
LSKKRVSSTGAAGGASPSTGAGGVTGVPEAGVLAEANSGDDEPDDPPPYQAVDVGASLAPPVGTDTVESPVPPLGSAAVAPA